MDEYFLCGAGQLHLTAPSSSSLKRVRVRFSIIVTLNIGSMFGWSRAFHNVKLLEVTVNWQYAEGTMNDPRF